MTAEAEHRFHRRKIAAGWLAAAHTAVRQGSYGGGHRFWSRAVEMALDAGMGEHEIPAKPEADEA